MVSEDRDIDAPLISVVMSVYNGERFLSQAIDSILSQTFTNFEFIIINDGSKDSSEQIIKRYKDPRIRLVNQSNHGLVYSLNRGVNLAKGAYIARQDQDDASLPSRFEKQLQLFYSDPRLGVVGTFFTYVDEETGIPKLTIVGPTRSIDIKRNMYITNPFGHGTVMFKREVLEKAGHYSDKFGPTEDFELWTRVADRWELAIVPESLYWYNLSKAGISHTNSSIQHEFTAKITSRQWDKPFLYKSPSHIIRDGHFYRNMASIYAKQIYGTYISLQVEVTRAALEHGYVRGGAKAAIATAILKPRTWYRFIIPFSRGLKRRLFGQAIIPR